MTIPMTRTFVICATALLSLLFLACQGETRAQGGPQGGRSPAVVSLAAVQQGAFEVEVSFVGRLRAESAAELYARTDGPIVAVHAGSGDAVRRGQLLAQIDPSDAQQGMEQSRAALRMAEATLEQRRANLQVARSTAERTENLFSEKLVSQSDFDVARAELITASSQLELARAQIQQAQANLGAARLELEKTRIVAPFDGYIGKRHLDLGAYATTNRAIFSIVDLSTIRTTIAIPAQNAAHIRPGQTASVTADVIPGKAFQGTVSRVSSVFDPETDTVEAEVEVANSEGELKPGMYATVHVAFRTEPSALLVPASAVVRNEQEEWLFVAEPDPTEGAEGLIARRVSVNAVSSSNKSVEVVAVQSLEGRLEPGMHVIVLGHQALTDGSPVTTVRATENERGSR